MKRTEIHSKITAALEAKTDQTTGDLADVLGLSTSRTREILSSMVKEGLLARRHIDEDGTKVFAFSLPATAKASDDDLLAADDGKAKGKKKAAAKKDPKAPKEPKARTRKPSSGLGHPNAKKIVNPQNTLELKKTAVRAAGGKMAWVNRKWVITGGPKKLEITLASRELAAMTLAEIEKMMG